MEKVAYIIAYSEVSVTQGNIVLQALVKQPGVSRFIGRVLV